jgi:predicted dienelactone hydrolase
MNTVKRSFAAVELLLIAPATLFMTALFVRNLQPQRFEPARTAQRIVQWYAARPPLGLWVFLILLPLTVLTIGLAGLWSSWRNDAELRAATGESLRTLQRHLATFLVAAATFAAGLILVIVAVHMAVD